MNLKEYFLNTHLTAYRNLGVLFKNWHGKAPLFVIFVHVCTVEQTMIHTLLLYTECCTVF